MKIFGGDFRNVLRVLHKFQRHFSANCRNFPFKAAHARFACVTFHDFCKRFVGNLYFSFGDSVQSHVFAKQKFVGDFHLFHFRVAGKFDNFHSVQKRRRNVVGGVCRADKQHLGQIEGYFQIVVGETEILFRIQYFQHCACRVAPVVHTHFVYFVQKQNGIFAFRLSHHVNDFAGNCPHIGASVSSYLRFVTHSAQTYTQILSAQSTGNTLDDRCFAHSRGTYKAQNGSVQFACKLHYGKKFHYSVFDFFQTVMVLVQNSTGTYQILVVRCFLVPRHIAQPVKVVAYHRRIGRS